MKPIKLEIEGLHSFEKNQVIDFRTLSSHGIFGIFGVTGSGKSTILDAIILSLYGKVQRSKTNSDFINLKSNKAVVSFEFSFTDNGKEKVYIVRRTFKRKNKNKQEVDQIAEVFEAGALGSRQIIEGATKVDNFITSLLGMSDVEFLKCIALPQGEFASFLKAKPNERVAIIGNIFDLNKYGQELWEKVRVKTEGLEKAKAVVDGKIVVLGEVCDGDLQAKKSELENISKETKEKSAKLAEISKIEKEEREVANLNQELEDVNKSLVEFADLADNMAVKKDTLNKAKKLNENRFVFQRAEELSKLIVAEEDDLYRSNEALKAERARSDEFYCASTMELEDLKEKCVKSVAKLERLKALKLLNDKVVVKQKELDISKQDLKINKNKNDSLVKKINLTKVERGLKATKLKEIDNELDSLQERLSGFESILTYNNLQLFSKELNTYKDYVELKHAEAVQAMTLALESKNAITAQKQAVEDELKKLYKNYGLKGSVGSVKIDAVVKGAYEDFAKFSKLKGKVEILLNERLNVATQICGEQNKKDRVEADKVRLDLKYKEMSDEIVEIKGKIKRVQEIKNNSLSENGVFDVVGRLKIGDTCPICCSEILRKASVSSIDVMVLDNEISELEMVLQRKEEAKENILYSIAKTVTLLEEIVSNLDELNSRQEELKKKLVRLFELDYSATVADEEEELARMEQALTSRIEAVEKSQKQEQSLLERYQELKENLIKHNCISVATRMEVGHWSELLENLSNSIKNKDIQLLSLVSQDENISDKLSKLEKLNEELDEKLKEKEQEMNKLAEIDAEITKLEAELAITINEQNGLEEKISQLENEVSCGKIEIDAETIDGDVEKTIAIEQAGYDGYRHREVELLSLQEDCKKGVVAKTNEVQVLQTKLDAHKQEHKGLAETILSVMNEVGLSSIQEAKLFMISEEEVAILSEKIEGYTQDIVIARNKKVELEKKLDGRISSPIILEQIVAQIAELNNDIKENNDVIVRLQYEIGTLETKLATLTGLKKEQEKIDKEFMLAKELYEVLKGKALMEFIAEEFIDDISFMASNKLQVLMDGRYVLKYQNKEFFVIDNFNDANVRPVSTLSGGELFVVSLALALSISDAIATKANKNVDFFFLDEGFGTLDKEYCEYIVDSLIKLESQNLTIGLISHIPELQERITQKLHVVKTANGSVVKIHSDI